MPNKRLSIILLILIILFTAISDILSGVFTAAVPKSLEPYLWLSGPLFLIITGSLIVLALVQYRLDQSKKVELTSPPEAAVLPAQMPAASDAGKFKYDVFISYSHHDEVWVTQTLVPRLEKEGLQVCIDIHDFVPGKASTINMQDAVRDSRFTLLVMTPAWVNSEWTSFEGLMAFQKSPSGLKSRMIPLLVEECEVPPFIAILTWVDFTRPDRQELAWAQLFNVLKGPVAPQPALETPVQSVDWAEAPEVDFFRGREAELAELRRWIVDEGCKLVSIFGQGGMGKTTLATKLARDIQNEPQSKFDRVIWRTLKNTPDLDTLLTEFILFFSNQRHINLPETTSKKILLLLDYLNRQRCLVILDNVESILQAEGQGSQYLPGYEQYGDLIQRVGETEHKSCLVMTSREMPDEFSLLVGETSRSRVRSWSIKPISTDAGRQILSEKGLVGSEDGWTDLIKTFSGNPLALKIAAETIRQNYGSDIQRFTREGAAVFGSVRNLLSEQFARLSAFEQHIMYWLAVERQSISLDELLEDILHTSSKAELQEAVSSLRRHSLIEQGDLGLTQQNLVLEFVTGRLVEALRKEIEDENPALFNTVVLAKAQAKDYIRDAQIRFIVKPIAEGLLARLARAEVEKRIMNVISKLQKEQPGRPGYGATNALNLLQQLGSDLSQRDFSYLVIMQAYLQGLELHGVNFSHANLAKSIFSENLGIVLAVAFSPNGQELAAANADGEVRVWQVDGLKQLFFCKGHTDWVWSVAFSPDGRILASSGDDQTIRLWDGVNGKLIRTLRGHTNWVRTVAFSPDGQLLASGSEDKTVRLWNVSTGAEVKTLSGHTRQVWRVAFAPDGQTLASGSGDQMIRLWNVGTGEVKREIEGDISRVFAVAFSNDGKVLAGAGDDQTIRLWNPETGELIKSLTGHKDRIWSLSFTPDGSKLVSSSEDRTVRVWDLETGEDLKTFLGHTNWVRSVVVSADGTTVASGSDDQTVRLWDINTKEPIRILHGYTNPMWSVAYSPDGRRVVSSSEDQNVQLWELESQKTVQVFHRHNNRVWSVAYSPNGRMVASGGDDQIIYLWDVETGEHIHMLQGHVTPVWSVAFSPDGKRLASGSEDQTVRLWDAGTGEELQVLKGHTSWVRSVAFSPDGSSLASGSDDESIKLWNVADGQLLQSLSGHKGRIWNVAYSSQKNLLASGGDDHIVRLWDLEQGQVIGKMQGHEGRVWEVSFSADGTLLASCSSDQTVRVWNVSTGECLHILQGHAGWIRGVAFHPTSFELASASQDGTIKIWNAQTGECLKTLRNARLYERMNITAIEGLTDAQKATLKALGAIDTP